MAIVVAAAAAAAALSLSAPLTPCRAVARANAPVMQFGGASMTDVMQKAKMAQMRMHDLELGGEGNSFDWAQPKPVGQSLSESNMQWTAGSPVRYSQYADTQPFYNRRQYTGRYMYDNYDSAGYAMGPRDSRYGPRYDNYGRGPSYDGRVYPSYGYNDERYYGDRRYDRGLDYRRDYDDRRMMYDSPGPYRGGYGGYGNEIMGLRSVEGLAQLVEYLSPEMQDLALRFCQQTGTPSVEVLVLMGQEEAFIDAVTGREVGNTNTILRDRLMMVRDDMMRRQQL